MPERRRHRETITIPDLPVGKYTLTVTVTGFKTYAHSNMEVDNAAVVRQDVAMAIGASAESVTVTAESTLLKTESADLTTNFTLSQLDDLPIFGIGTTNSGTSGYRNPYNTLLTMPGVTGFATGAAFGLTVNGVSAPQSIIMEGQDATDRTFGGVIYYQIGQPSVDSIQEMSYQVSNYSPEFGQAGSAAINFTFKGGSNQYHGSGYDNFVNEDLNAGEPFSTTGCIDPLANSFASQKVPTCYANGGSGGKVRPRNRRNDFGGTLGGPIVIPKIYNGHNKSFFFWSYEEYLETTGLNFADTVPTTDYLGGNFGHISPNGDCSLCSQLGIQTTALGSPTVQKDALGNSFYANENLRPRHARRRGRHGSRIRDSVHEQPNPHDPLRSAVHQTPGSDQLAGRHGAKHKSDRKLRRKSPEPPVLRDSVDQNRPQSGRQGQVVLLLL